MKNFILDSNIQCTTRPANHVFLSLGRGSVFLKISLEIFKKYTPLHYLSSTPLQNATM